MFITIQAPLPSVISPYSAFHTAHYMHNVKKAIINHVKEKPNTSIPNKMPSGVQFNNKVQKNVYTVHENIFIRLQTNKQISVSFQFSGECNVSYAATPLIAMKTRLKYL